MAKTTFPAKISYQDTTVSQVALGFGEKIWVECTRALLDIPRHGILTKSFGLKPRSGPNLTFGMTDLSSAHSF